MKLIALFVSVLAFVLSIAACGSSDNPNPIIALQPTKAIQSESTAAATATTEATIAPTPTVEAANPAQMAEAYIRAVYAGDDVKAKDLYLFYHPDPNDEERKVTLESLAVGSLTREKAGDKDPLSEWQYFEVTTTVSFDGKKGQGRYKIGLMPMEQAGGALKVNLISGGIQWE